MLKYSPVSSPPLMSSVWQSVPPSCCACRALYACRTDLLHPTRSSGLVLHTLHVMTNMESSACDLLPDSNKWHAPLLTLHTVYPLVSGLEAAAEPWNCTEHLGCQLARQMLKHLCMCWLTMNTHRLTAWTHRETLHRHQRQHQSQA